MDGKGEFSWKQNRIRTPVRTKGCSYHRSRVAIAFLNDTAGRHGSITFRCADPRYLAAWADCRRGDVKDVDLVHAVEEAFSARSAPATIATAQSCATGSIAFEEIGLVSIRCSALRTDFECHTERLYHFEIIQARLCIFMLHCICLYQNIAHG